MTDDLADVLTFFEPQTKGLPGGRVATVFPLTFGRARIGIGPVGSLTYDDAW